eukprot:Hpha_TRINITY_DN15709_c5_g3::TRINITY_DN15709_c5_g3_i1::g.37308::m.37308
MSLNGKYPPTLSKGVKPLVIYSFFLKGKLNVRACSGFPTAQRALKGKLKPDNTLVFCCCSFEEEIQGALAQTAATFQNNISNPQTRPPNRANRGIRLYLLLNKYSKRGAGLQKK